MGPLFEQVLDENLDSVKIVFKHYPLAFHKLAKPAALASMAAQEQGKFWDFHDLLFENQKSLSPEKIISIAQQLGLNISRFSSIMRSPASMQKLTQDIKDARDAGVTGTPAIFVNGRRLKKRDFPTLQKLINEEIDKLKKAGN